MDTAVFAKQGNPAWAEAPAGLKPARPDLWIAAGVFVSALVFRYLSTTNLHNDHYMHLAWANQVLAGEWPVRDFVDPGMPLTYLVSALAHALVRRGVLGEVWLSAGFLAFGAALTFVLARRASGSGLVGLLAALVQIVIAPRLYSYPKIVLHLWAVWALWRYAERPTRANVAGLAVCTAVAFLMRHDHGVYIAVASLVLVGLVRRSAAPGPRLSRLTVYAAVTGGLILPWLVYVQISQGVVEYFRTGVGLLQSEHERGRLERWPPFDLTPASPALPVVAVRWASDVDTAVRTTLEARYGLGSPVAAGDRTWRYVLNDASPRNVVALLNDPAVEDTHGLDRHRARVLAVDKSPLDRAGLVFASAGLPHVGGFLKRQNAVAMVYTVFVTVPFVALLLVALRRFRSPERPDSYRDPLIISVAALAVVTNAGFLRDPLEARLADAAAVPLVVGAWLIGQSRARTDAGAPSERNSEWLGGFRRRLLLRGTARVGIWVVVGLILVGAADVGDLPRTLEKTRLLAGPRSLARHVRDQLRELGATPRVAGWIGSGDERRELKQLTAYLRDCTAPDDYVLVTWFAPEVYYYAERKFAAGVAFFYPGFFTGEAEERRSVQRLEHQKVPIVLAEADTYERFFTREHPRLATFLATHYRLVAEIAATDKRRYRVLVDTRLEPEGTWQPLGLPCFG